MRTWGFVAGVYSPCRYLDTFRKLRCLVHVDDFVCAGEPTVLECLNDKLQRRFEIKTTTVGTNAATGELKEARIPAGL